MCAPDSDSGRSDCTGTDCVADVVEGSRLEDIAAEAGADKRSDSDDSGVEDTLVADDTIVDSAASLPVPSVVR